MKKLSGQKTNGNVFKTIVRSVVQEELSKTVEWLDRKWNRRFDTFNYELREEIKDQMDKTFRKYRDETLIKMDQVIGEIKTVREEITMHSGQHEDINDRPEKLEKIHPHGRHA